MGHLLTKIKPKPKSKPKNIIIIVQPPPPTQHLITIPEEPTLERPKSRRSKKRLPNNFMNELF